MRTKWHQHLGIVVHKLRSKKGLTQIELAHKSKLSLKTIIRCEIDESFNPNLNTVNQMADALDISLLKMIQMISESFKNSESTKQQTKESEACES